MRAPEPAGRLMDLVTHEVARFAMYDPFLARPPYFQADVPACGQAEALRRTHPRRPVKVETHATACER